MGFFDNIKSKVVAAADEYKTAYEWGKGQSTEAVCEAMKEAKGMTLNGYIAAFKDRCEEMETRDLKALYDEVTGRNKPGLHINLSLKKNHAAEAIEDILVRRRVWKRNDDGTIDR